MMSPAELAELVNENPSKILLPMLNFMNLEFNADVQYNIDFLHRLQSTLSPQVSQDNTEFNISN